MDMKRNGTIRICTTVAVIAAFTTTPLLAQVSQQRIRELIDAANATQQAQGPFNFNVQAPTGAGPTVQLTLDEAIRLALERNLDIAVQRMNPEISDIAIATAQAAFRPTLSSTISRSSTTSTPTSQLNQASGGNAQVSTNLTYNASIQQMLPWWGATVTGQFNNNRQESNSNNVLLNPQYNSTWTGQLSVPLLRDRAIDTQRRAILVSKVNRDISDIQLRASLTNLVSNVRNAYWDFVFATQAVDVARQSLALATKLVEDNTVKVEVGTMAKIDIVQAQTAQAQRQQALVTAESSRRTSEIALKRMIVSGTDDPNWMATIDPVDRPEFDPQPVDVEAAIRRALDNRTDLAIVKKNLERNDLALRLYRNNTLPTVDFNLNYGLQGVGGTQLIRGSGQIGAPPSQIIPGGLSDALSNLLRATNPRWTASFNISYPLGLNAQETQLATARVQLNQIQAQLKSIELQVANDITQAALNLRNTAEAVQAAQTARILSEQQLEAEQSKFEVGMSTNYQVVTYQRDLQDARNSELRAILNYRKAQVEWDRLQETALGNNNIQIL
jgi:outer membrane protein TolC